MASSNIESTALLVTAFDNCLAMQADHLANIKAGSLTKIAQWLEERQMAVTRLRQALTDTPAARLDENLRAILLEKIQAILNTEKDISTLAAKQRESISEQLAGIRQGKRALGHYNSAPKKHVPQIVSNKG